MKINQWTIGLAAAGTISAGSVAANQPIYSNNHHRCRCGSKMTGQAEELGAGDAFVCKDWPKCTPILTHCFECHQPKDANWCPTCRRSTGWANPLDFEK